MRNKLMSMIGIIFAIVLGVYMYCFVQTYEDVIIVEGKFNFQMQPKKTKAALNKLEKLTISNSEKVGYLYSTAQKQVNHQEVSIYYIDDGYKRLDHMKWLSGARFTSKDIAYNRQYVIIDERAAIDQFNTLDCIGKDLEVDHFKYEVVGVVRQRKVLHKLIDAKPAIYLPRGQSKEETWYGVYTYKSNHKAILIEKLETILEEASYYKIVDLNRRVYSILNKLQLTFLFAWSFVVLKYLRYLIYNMHQLKISYLESERIGYLKTFIQSNGWNLGHLLVLLMGTFLMLMPYQYFELKINPQLIPHTLAEWSTVKAKILEMITYINSEPSIHAVPYVVIIWLDKITNIIYLPIWGVILGRGLFNQAHVRHQKAPQHTYNYKKA